MSLKGILLSCAGFVLLALGAIGLFLPVWPTTPFVLGAAGCFASTPALYARIARLPLFGDYLTNYRHRSGLPRRTVAVSLTFLWAMLLVSALCAGALWVRLLLMGIGAAVTAHILWIARARKQ